MIKKWLDAANVYFNGHAGDSSNVFVKNKIQSVVF